MAPKRQPSPFRAMTFSDAVSKINAIFATTGVMASATTENKVLLTDADGDDILITNGSSGTSLRVQAVENDGVTAQTATAISLAANGGNDTSQVVGTLRLSSSSGFTVTQTNGSSDTFFCRRHCDRGLGVSWRY